MTFLITWQSIWTIDSFPTCQFSQKLWKWSANCSFSTSSPTRCLCINRSYRRQRREAERVCQWTPRCWVQGVAAVTGWRDYVPAAGAKVKSICHWPALVLSGTGLESAGRTGLNIFYALYMSYLPFYSCFSRTTWVTFWKRLSVLSNSLLSLSFIQRHEEISLRECWAQDL